MSEKDSIPWPFTAIPNTFFDEHMRRIKGANAKLAYLLILRRTIGGAGRPREAAITLAEFRAYIGIAEDHTVEAALSELKDAGYIIIAQPGGPKSVKFYAATNKVLQSVENTDASVKKADRPAGESVKNTDTNLQKLQKGIGKKDRNPSVENTETDQPHINRQGTSDVPPTESDQGAKESVKEKGKKDKEIAPSPLAQAGGPTDTPRVVDEKEEEKTIRASDLSSPPSSLLRRTMAADAQAKDVGAAGRAAEFPKKASDIAASWWGRVKEDMRAAIGPVLWQSHLEPTRGLRLEGDLLLVFVPTRASIDALKNGRLKREIEHILNGVAGRKITVEYQQEEG